MVNGLGGRWRPVLWLVFTWSALLLVAIVLLAEETWYDRSLEVQPSRSTGLAGRFKDLIGITAFEQRKYKASVKSSVMRLLEVRPFFRTRFGRDGETEELMRFFSFAKQVFAKPVTWFVFVVYALSFMWSVGINISDPTPIPVRVPRGKV